MGNRAFWLALTCLVIFVVGATVKDFFNLQFDLEQLTSKSLIESSERNRWVAIQTQKQPESSKINDATDKPKVSDSSHGFPTDTVEITSGNIKGTFNRDGAIFISDKSALGIRLTGLLNKNKKLILLPQDVLPVQKDNRLVYERGTITEYFTSTKEGIEHSLLIRKPDFHLGDELIVGIDFSGGIKGADIDGDDIYFPGSNIRYSHLSVFDSNGKKLKTFYAKHEDKTYLHVVTSNASWPILIDPIISTERQSVRPKDNNNQIDEEAAALFGQSAAIKGDLLAVGAPAKSCTLGASCGATYIYKRNGDNWDFTQKLTATPLSQGPNAGLGGEQKYARFGEKIVTDGNTIAVFAPGEYCTGTTQVVCGVIYLYSLINNTWTLNAIVGPTDSSSGFGASISLDNDWLFVGAPGFKLTVPWGYGTYYGSAGIVHTWHRENGAWVRKEELVARNPDGTDASSYGGEFGGLVTVRSGKAIVRGIPGKHTKNGYVFFYYHYLNGSWVIQQSFPLLKSATEAETNYSGSYWSLDAEGDLLAIGNGSRYCENGVYSPGGPSCGAAYIYKYDLASNQYHFKQKLVSQNIDGSIEQTWAQFGSFGSGIKLSNSYLAISSQKPELKIYLYRLNAQGLYTIQEVISDPEGKSTGAVLNLGFSEAYPDEIAIGFDRASCDSGSNCGILRQYLLAPAESLTITQAGTGKGTISTLDNTFLCGGDCVYSFTHHPLNSSVTLIASPLDGYRFIGWSGDCNGFEATCTLSMSQGKNVTANYDSPILSANVTVANKPYDGSTAAVITGCVLNPATPGVSCDISNAEASFTDAEAGINKTVTISDLGLIWG